MAIFQVVLVQTRNCEAFKFKLVLQDRKRDGGRLSARKIVGRH
jgi:hypothetical protein